MGKWKTVSVKEATVNACVAAEVMCWFFIGEIIGKGTIVGYQVHPKAVDAEVSFGSTLLIFYCIFNLSDMLVYVCSMCPGIHCWKSHV